ncbi:MAG TPA: hypothetical protein VL096_15035 [Pirellulaceae bacterium]|nr:hypothetical protein [Pirellulaceae bacterium]
MAELLANAGAVIESETLYQQIFAIVWSLVNPLVLENIASEISAESRAA